MGSLNRSLRLIAEKHFAKSNWKNIPTLTQKYRSIMTTSAAAEKALEKLKSNPYFEKYGKKIANLQQTSPEEFLAKLEEAQIMKSKLAKPLEEKHCASSASARAKANLQSDMSCMQSKSKGLADVMRVDLLESKTADEIKLIWQEYYKLKEGLAATIPSDVYSLIHERSKKYPMFLLPLPRANGYEFIVCQFAGHQAHFTPLINYQTHKENAPECLTLMHHVELMDMKGLVLMRGEFDKNTVDAKEAQCLANQVQLYYGHPDEKRLKLLERFTHTPGEFRHIDLLAELEIMTL